MWSRGGGAMLCCDLSKAPLWLLRQVALSFRSTLTWEKL